MSIDSGKAVTLSAVTAASTDARFAAGPGRMAVNLGARLCDEGSDRQVAFLLCHPNADFSRHCLLPHLARHGVAAFGMATRYINNDLDLLMERCVQDMGRGVAFLREQGYEKVVLIGHSGGASLSCFYQAEAETPTVTTMPDGDPFEMGALDRADGLILLAAHPSRAQALTSWLDPAIVDEGDPARRDPALDLFTDRPVPYDRAWLATFRAAQVARNRRISDHALAVLDDLRRRPDGPDDAILTVHGTSADPRFIDPTLDPNGRQARSVAQVARLNETHLSMGRLSTLRSWLSQWSLDHSRADGPACLGRTKAPAALIEFEKDDIVFPSYIRSYAEARPDGVHTEMMPGATHFLTGQTEVQDRLARRVVELARSQCA